MNDTKINDGGPAFPCDVQVEDNGGSHYEEHYGLTMRDWFAGRMLAQIFATQVAARKTCTWQEMAEIAYSAADAMLAARKEKV